MSTATTTYASFIKYLREERKLAQADVATATGMSRASYVAVEKGTKELTLAEADAITKLFGLTIDELLQTVAPNLTIYRQMMLAYLRVAKGDKATLKKTKLAQLLYLADFSWYFYHQKSMSGVSYRHTDFGPLADVYFRLLEEMEAGGIINIKQIYRDDYHMYEIEETRTSAKKPLTELNKKQLSHLTNIWKAWSDASTAEIVTFTSEQAPYQNSVPGEIISYDAILTTESYSLY
jgi:transcriptional regulator with XRE-family HTH domain